MKKSTLFIVSLLCIVIAELIMVFKSDVSEQPQKYALDTMVLDMPKHEVKSQVVKPFLFELHSANEVDAILDEFAADINKSMTSQNAEDAPKIQTSELPVEEEQIVLIEDEELADVSDKAEQPKIVISEDNASEISVMAKENSVKDINFDIAQKVDEDKKIEEKQSDNDKPLIETQSEVVVSETEVPTQLAKVAVVIDDVGLSVPFTKKIAEIKAPLTVSFLPYGAANKEQAETLKSAGFEIMVHIPMMPHIPAALAPVTLSPEMSKDELQTELNKMLDRFEGAGMSGVNNHMGSLLTERIKNMENVMEVLKKRGMFFLDSKTTAKSVAQKAADEYEVAYISRDVFLDNKNDYNYIMGQFRQAEKVAKKNGYAVAIGHPYSQTLNALRDWLKEAHSHDIEVVHLSELLAKK